MRSSNDARKGFADTVIIVTSVFISGARSRSGENVRKKNCYSNYCITVVVHNILYDDVAAVCPAAGARSIYTHHGEKTAHA